MYCTRCGKELADGEVCMCQSQTAEKQQTPDNGQPPKNQQPFQNNQMSGGRQQEPINSNTQNWSRQYNVPNNQNTPNWSGQPNMQNGSNMQNQTHMSNQFGQANVQNQPNMPNRSNMPNRPYQQNQPNRPVKPSNPQKQDQAGMVMFIVSLAVSVVGIIVFLLLRFMLADTLSDLMGEVVQYLIYIIPGVLGIIGCVFGIFSLQSKKLRPMSIVAIALGAVVTIFVIVSMILFPYEFEGGYTADTRHEAMLDEEVDKGNKDSKDDVNDVTGESTEETANEASAEVDAMVQNYEASKDYAQAKQALNALDVSNLSSDDADRVIEFQNTIESDLRTEMQGYADASDYTSLFSKLKTYESALSDDSLLKEIRNTYEADYVVYLDEQSHSLAEDGKKDEAIAMLDEARGYLTDASVIDDLKETVESLGADYIIPDSDSRYLSRSELSKYTLQEINYAKNEIYARHGRQFASNELQNYFNSKSWYHGTVSPSSFSEGVFNDYERKNVQTLKEEEFSRDSRGYQLDQ